MGTETERRKQREKDVVLSRGYMLFLLAPARMVMAAVSPMRSSFRLGWRIKVFNPPEPTHKEHRLQQRGMNE